MARGFISTADIVSLVIDAHSENIKDKYCINMDMKNALLNRCDAADKISDLYGGLSTNAVVESDNCLTLSLELSDVIIDKKTNYIYKLIDSAVKFSVKKGDDSVFLNFTFPSVWEKANG